MTKRRTEDDPVDQDEDFNPLAGLEGAGDADSGIVSDEDDGDDEEDGDDDF